MGGRWREMEGGREGGREGRREGGEGREEQGKERGAGYIVPQEVDRFAINCDIIREAIDNNTAELKHALSWKHTNNHI